VVPSAIQRAENVFGNAKMASAPSNGTKVTMDRIGKFTTHLA